jgi:hypothetical protein
MGGRKEKKERQEESISEAGVKEQQEGGVAL